MIATAWYMVAEYKLNLGYKDTLQKIVLHISQKYGISSSEPKKKIIEFLEATEDLELIAMRKILYNYVPYLLISPFYDVELRRIPNTKSALKNLTIMELSYSDEGTLYSFTAEKDTIIVNDIWFDYLYMNQTIINGWLNYKLINYLQKKNPNVPGIPFKLEPPHARKLVA